MTHVMYPQSSDAYMVNPESSCRALYQIHFLRWHENLFRIFALRMDHKALLANINEVSAISDEDFCQLLTCTRLVAMKKGDLIQKEGETCRAFYIVNTGYLRTFYNKDGVEINLNFTFEGHFTTDLKSIKNKKPSEFNIEAGEDGAVWEIDRDKLSQYYKSNPQIALFIRRLAIRLLLASEEHSNLFKLYTPTERYHYIEQHSPRLLQRVSLSQLSSYLGVSRETLSRIRAKSK